MGEEEWGPGCGRTFATTQPIQLDARRTCDGHESIELAAQGPEGRWSLVWERSTQEGAEYALLAVAAPPRYAGWYADPSQCEMRFGASGVACPAGGPPAPPPLPWGHLLP